MDAAHEIPDSTDWLNTPLSGFTAVENALHCQICKEFFDTPMITSCSHTFCSKCIRTALSIDGCCPACRKQDQASKLRNNWQLQEVVTTFLEARPAAFRLAKERQPAGENAAKRPGKRKRTDLDSEQVREDEEVGGRTNRRKSQRLAGSQASHSETIDVSDDDRDEVDGEFIPETQEPNDGLVECPLGCGKRMKIELVDPHLDRCDDERLAAQRAKSRTPIHSSKSTSRDFVKSHDRLNELNYSMMKERDLAKKLKELGIPNWGNKQLMIRRHTEWVNFWNANCDSSMPRLKRELLRELEMWEQTQGGSAPTVTNRIMKKDFDSSEWSKRNQDEFSRLIEDARKSRQKPVVNKDEQPRSHGTSETGTQAATNVDPTIQALNHAIAGQESHEESTAASLSAHEPVSMSRELMEPREASKFEPNSSQPSPQLPESGGQHDALMAQAHFGHESQNTVVGEDGKTRSEGKILPNLKSPPVKKMPMFEMQEQPVKDVDGPSLSGSHG